MIQAAPANDASAAVAASDAHGHHAATTVPVPVRAQGGHGLWIFGPAIDASVFVLPTVAAFLFLAVARALHLGGSVPPWGWFVFVLVVDVAHVWATLFRTYLDPEELRRRPWLYALLPVVCWAIGVSLHAHSSLLFWRVLAYLAVFHFIRQQIGWMGIYRAKSGARSSLDRFIDESTIYLATGVPLLIWHTRMPRPFVWFVPGDFFSLPVLAPLVPVMQVLLAASLVCFALHHLRRARDGEPVPPGKIAVVMTTAISWYAGIVLAKDDLTFTVLNVLPHGIPYFALLWAYGRARAKRAPEIPGSRIVRAGFASFLGVLLICAFVEEMLWDRLIFPDHSWLFGFLPSVSPRSTASAWPDWRTFVVPFLALPQATHYALDAFLWRRRDTGPEQGEALGFPSRPARPPAAEAVG
jgi:hypothetical protein